MVERLLAGLAAGHGGLHLGLLGLLDLGLGFRV